MRLSRFAIVLVSSVLALSACASNPTEVATATPGNPTAAAPEAKPSTPAAAKSAPKAASVPDKPASHSVVPAKMITVPAGTELTVVLIDPVSSEKNKAGDKFMASLAAPLVIDGKTVADRGTKVQGRVVDAEASGRVKGRASIRLVLNGIMDGGKLIPIVTKPFVAEAEATKGRDAAIVGGGAGIGAAIGAATGGKKGAGLGALIGGAAGSGTVLATKGKEVEFDSESKLNFTLDKDAELPAKM